MNKPIQTSSTAVEPPSITEIRRPNSFGNLFVDANGKDVTGSAAILDVPDFYRYIKHESEDE